MLPKSLLPILLLAVSLPAQKTRTHKNLPLGVAYKVPGTLAQIPINKLQDSPHLKDRWSATKKPLYGKGGTYVWEMNIMVFQLRKGKGGAPVTKGGEEEGKNPPRRRGSPGKPDPDAQVERIRKMRLQPDFATWLHKAPQNRDVQIDVEGKKLKQKSGDRLPYTYYEWRSHSSSTTWIHKAACYELEGREIVLIIHYPDEFEKKLKRVAKTCYRSLALLKKKRKTKDGQIEGEEFADIDPGVRKPLLAKAKESIKNLKNWNIFCTPNYIVLYSWDRPDKKSKARSFAEHIASRMDEMREVYMEYFPPEKGAKPFWSVLRICSTAQEFNRYGGTSGGVIGWFNPLSKELVIFNGKGAFSTETVAYHEGWHQYADFWFGGAHLHRWFDEGHGDFFGSMKRVGRGRWKPATSKMRKGSIKTIVATHKYVPLGSIVRWHKDKFYGPRAPDYYAQGWAMVDFLRRGSRSRRFKKAWKKILPTYIRVAKETKDTDRAVEEAFRGVDWEEFEKSWVEWVKRGI